MGCEESFLANPGLARRTHFRGRVQTEFLMRRTQRPAEGQLAPQLTEGLFSITDEDIDMIEDLLQSHHLFYKVRSFTGREIIAKLEKFTAEAGETIFKKGDIADYFYIILSGSVEISGFAEGVEGRILQRGNCFGDLGIQNKAARSGTAVAKSEVRLLGLRKNHFLRVSLELIRRAQNEIFKEIKAFQVFSILNMHQKHKISFLAQELKFPKGSYIFRKGENSDCFYVIRTGKVRLDVPDKQSIEINSRQSFGESCLKQQKNLRVADAICTESCVLLAFNKRDMIKYLGSSLQQIEISNKIIWSLKREPTFAKISHIILEAMIDSKQVKHFRDGEIVAQKGEAVEHFIIPLEGGINDKTELQLINCSYLKGLNFQTEDLVKHGDGMVVSISIDQIESKFNRKFNLLLNIDHMISKEIQSYMAIQEYAKTLSLDLFRVAEVKGVGDYGPTLRVRSDSNIEFALKVFQKARVITDCAHQSVYMLRTVNKKVAHNLIARTYRIYSDSQRLYFLNKLVGGETLCDCLSRQGKLPLPLIRHFSACMINILEYLHCKRILWREMKMESFVIDWGGYINLVDLMYLQELKEDEFYIDTPARATLYYLSPETLSGQGYGLQSDFWALGVIIYRMAVGHFPFGQQITQEDPSVLDVLSDQINAFGLKLPQWVPSEVKLLLKLLLNPNSLERSLISINRLKSMTIFMDYDWLGLMEKNMKHVPYLPRRATNRIIPNETSIQEWIGSQSNENPPNDCLEEILDI